MQKKSKKLGKRTLVVEVQNISKHGILILIDNAEYFVSFIQYPWFQKANIDEIYDVQYEHEKHLHWSRLDIDLEIDSLKHPQAYPLIYK